MFALCVCYVFGGSSLVVGVETFLDRLDEMNAPDSTFWSLIKELSGLSGSRSNSSPSVEDLATHFAEKMSNGKDDDDPNFTLNNDARCSLSSFKISRKKVKQSLKI